MPLFIGQINIIMQIHNEHLIKKYKTFMLTLGWFFSVSSEVESPSAKTLSAFC